MHLLSVSRMKLVGLYFVAVYLITWSTSQARVNCRQNQGQDVCLLIVN